MKPSVTLFSKKYGTLCKGHIDHETSDLFTIDITEIQIDDSWIPYDKFAEILKKAFPFNQIPTYEIVEKSDVELLATLKIHTGE